MSGKSEEIGGKDVISAFKRGRLRKGHVGMEFTRTVVIPCAGMGNRLGLGMPKALLEIEGKPLIIRQLEMLNTEGDVRVIVGYQAEKVIETVQKYRKDVNFVFNYNYEKTGTGDSVALGAFGASQYVLTLDGDLLVHPDDMKMVLECRNEFVGGGAVKTEDPWLIQTGKSGQTEFVKAFSKGLGNYEWNGIAQMKREKFQKGTGHVFQLIEPYLPIEFMKIRTREIDTPHDYQQAVEWVKNNFQETKSV